MTDTRQYLVDIYAVNWPDAPPLTFGIDGSTIPLDFPYLNNPDYRIVGPYTVDDYGWGADSTGTFSSSQPATGVIETPGDNGDSFQAKIELYHNVSVHLSYNGQDLTHQPWYNSYRYNAGMWIVSAGNDWLGLDVQIIGFVVIATVYGSGFGTDGPQDLHYQISLNYLPEKIQDFSPTLSKNGDVYTVSASEILQNFTNYDGDPLSLTSVSMASFTFLGTWYGGQIAVNNGNGTFSFNSIAPLDQIPLNFYYEVTDGKDTVQFNGGQLKPYTGLLDIVVNGAGWTVSDYNFTYTGDATIGLKGSSALMRVHNAQLYLDENLGTLSITGGEVDAITGAGDIPLYKGGSVWSQIIPLKYPDAGFLEQKQDLLKLGGQSVNITRIGLGNDGLRVVGSFNLPQGVLGSTQAIKDVDLLINSQGVQLNGSTPLMLRDKISSSGQAFRFLNEISISQDDLTLGYDFNQDKLFLKGDISIPTEHFGMPTLSLSDADISITNGVLQSSGTLSLAEFTVPGIGAINGLNFAFNTASDAYQINTTLTPDSSFIKTAEKIDASAKFGFFPDLHIDNLDLKTVFKDSGVFLPGCEGVTLKYVHVNADNVIGGNKSAEWSGYAGFSYKLPNAFGVNIQAKTDFKHSISGSAVGGFVMKDPTSLWSDTPTVNALIEFSGKSTLDWSKSFFSLDGQYTVNNPLTDQPLGQAYGECTVSWAKYLCEEIKGRGTLNYPLHSISGNFVCKYSDDNNLTNDYLDVWVTDTVDFAVWSNTFTIGARLNLNDPSDIRTLGAKDVPLIGSWAVDATQISDLLVTLNWENANSEVIHTHVVIYSNEQDHLARSNGTIIAEQDYAANGIQVISSFSTSNSEVIYVSTPYSGIWDVEIDNSNGLGLITKSATTTLKPISVAVGAVSSTGSQLTIEYSTVDPNVTDNNSSKVDFYIDTDNKGENGIHIGSANLANGSSSATFDLSAYTNGIYWVYAVLDDGMSIPVSAYSSSRLYISTDPNNHAPILNIPNGLNVSMPANYKWDATNGLPVGYFWNNGVGATDVDANTSYGIAIYGVTGILEGKVEYSTDGGLTWQSPTSPVSESNALLLGGNALVRYTPPINAAGTRTDLFHLWDGTGGYGTGDYVDLTAPGATGGSTPFSAGTSTFTINITGNVGDIYASDNNNASLVGTSAGQGIYGRAGNDTLTGLGGVDTLNGGDGSDIYLMTSASDHPAAEINDTGTVGTDEVRFTSTTPGQTLMLYAGDTGIESVVIGTGTNATAITSGTTALNINAANVANALSIKGNAGTNILIGTAYADTIDGGAGSDIMLGGLGDDVYIVDKLFSAHQFHGLGSSGLGDIIFEGKNAGIDTVQTSLSYGLGNNLENLTLTGSANVNGTGNNLNNTIIGNAGNNVLNGGSGNDKLNGGAGDDRLYGGAGDDRLIGGLGNNTLSGGGGQDGFVFKYKTGAMDTIIDFKHSEHDKLVFSKAVFDALLSDTPTDLGVALNSSDFASGSSVNASSNLGQHLLYNSSTGALYYDADGSGANLGTQIAKLGTNAHPSLAYTDFLVVI